MYPVLHLGLTYLCNMHCRHCYVGRKADELEFSDIKTVIDFLDSRGLMMVYYTYGEPLMYKNFFDVVDYISSKKMAQILMTNGSLIDADKAKRIKTSGINNVYISIDSASQEKHDFNRKYCDAYCKAINAIRLLKKEDVNIGIATTVTKDNVFELGEILNIAEREHVNIISFLRERTNNLQRHFSDRELVAYHDFVLKCITDSRDINILFHDPALLSQLYIWHNSSLIDNEIYDKYKQMCTCHAKETLCITPNGDVGHCNLSNSFFGNIKTKPIISIFEENADENIIYCSAISK